MDERNRHRLLEDEFHRQLRARAEALVRGPLPADRVTIESVPDGIDGVRATLMRLERFERDLLERLEGDRVGLVLFAGLLDRDQAGLDQAREQAAATASTLFPLAEAGVPIVFCEPGCFSAVRDDHPLLLRGELKEKAQAVAAAAVQS